MTQYVSYAEAQRGTLLWLNKRASLELRNLLENKHLYQKVDFNPAEAASALHKNILMDGERTHFADWANHTLPNEKFLLPDEQPLTETLASIQGISIPFLKLQNPKLFCQPCDRREAFAPVWSVDFAAQIPKLKAKNSLPLPVGFQLLLLVYQCQSCLGTPEGFLVRRDGWTFTLQGRSPMEHIEVPKYVPKDERKLFRDALIAFNSGKTLAAIFYLRTFVEQFARRITDMKGRVTGEEILDGYYLTLPAPMKNEMPSLREWYDKLSVALHAAVEDEALFEAGKAAIEKHFEIRKVFNLSEGTTLKAEKPATSVS